jgi:glutamate/aspartate transport system substrate-binding protein
MPSTLHRSIPWFVPAAARGLAALAQLGLAGLLGLSHGPCPAAATGDDTLVRLSQTGRIVLGASDNAVPLSYLDSSGAHIGYHMDVCLRVVKAIQQRFDLPALKVVTVPTTPATRFALLNNNTIDIECADNAVRASSLSQALLSHATMISEIHLMTTVDRPPLSLATLGGRSVGVVGGSSAVPALRALARKGGSKITEVYGRGADESFSMLEAGLVDSIAFAAPTLMAQRARSATPARYLMLDGVLLAEPVALMFRLNDEKLHALANEVLATMMKNGEMARLYDKWFVKPIPGLPQPMGLPLPAALRTLFDAPGSEMLSM